MTACVTLKLTSFLSVGISGYESVFAKETGVLKVHLSLLQLTKDVTRENFTESKWHFRRFYVFLLANHVIPARKKEAHKHFGMIFGNTQNDRHKLSNKSLFFQK